MTPLHYAVLINFRDALKCMFDCVPWDKGHELPALQDFGRKPILIYCSYICNGSQKAPNL